jgi:CRP-like cAMP-binding protein
VTSYRNILLKMAPPECLAAVEPHLEDVRLERGQMIADPAQSIEFVFFMENSLVSLISHLDEKRDVELGLIGREGMSGDAIVLGDDRSPFTARVQMPGSAFRITARRLREALTSNRDLHHFLLNFVRAQHLQVASTAASNQRGTVEERLARWVLMAHDRIDGDRLYTTHVTLSWLLGVRRPSVTEALHLLEGKGLIRSERNIIIVRDRKGRQEAAGRAYGLAEREYARLIGTDFREHNLKCSPDAVPELFVGRDSPEDEG